MAHQGQNTLQQTGLPLVMDNTIGVCIDSC